MDNSEEFIWAQKYRPHNIDDVVLPEKIKDMFREFIKKGEVPNLLLSGPAGTGKTTIAKVVLESIDADYIIINGSVDNGISVFRETVTRFASTMSFTGRRKYVIVDESDYMTHNAQAAFRGLIEEFSKNCGFILTCNFKYNLIAPIRESRFNNIDFHIPKADSAPLKAKFFKRIIHILNEEKVEYDKAVLAKVIDKNFPDYRRVLTNLQSYAATGKIDAGILRDVKRDNIEVLFKYLKEKDFTSMRQWVADNADQDASDIFKRMYDVATDKVTKENLPEFIVTLGEYMYKHNFVSSPEINMAAFLTEVMFSVEFK